MEQKQKKMPTWAKIVIGFFVLAFIGRMLPKTSDTPIQESEASKIEKFRQAQNDTLRNCYIVAKTFLKENLKDPDSYDEVEEQRYFVTDSKTVYIQVKIKYRAKNSFGALNLEQRCFNFDKRLSMIGSSECQ